MVCAAFRLAIATLAAAGAALPALAGPAEPLVVDLYFDLAADSLAGLEAAPDGTRPADSEILIAGIPLHIGTEAGEVGWRTLAGARGRYNLALGPGLSFTGRAQFSNTDFVDDGVADSAVGLAAGELRYATDGWVFALQPGVEVTRWTDGETQRDMIAEGRIGAPIADGLRLAMTGRYRWRALTGVDAPHREIAFGRLGLVCDLPHRAELNLGLVARQESASVVTRSQGPTVGLTLPLGDSADLSASYAYTATTRREGASVPAIPREDLHHLGLAMRWDIGGDRSDAALSAGYSFEHSSARPDEDRGRHVGTVELALSF